MIHSIGLLRTRQIESLTDKRLVAISPGAARLAPANGPAARIRSLARVLLASLRRAGGRDEMLLLNDHLLRDVGIDRADLEAQAWSARRRGAAPSSIAALMRSRV